MLSSAIRMQHAITMIGSGYMWPFSDQQLPVLSVSADSSDPPGMLRMEFCNSRGHDWLLADQHADINIVQQHHPVLQQHS